MQPAADPDRRGDVIARRIAGHTHRDIAAELGIDRGTVARDLAAARLDPEEIALRRRECIAQLGRLRAVLRAKAEAGDDRAIELVAKCIEIETRLILAATGWEAA